MTATEFPREAAGIAHVRCLVCGHESSDPMTLELWNGYGDCPSCYMTNARWSMTDGRITDIVEGKDGELRRTPVVAPNACCPSAAIGDGCDPEYDHA